MTSDRVHETPLSLVNAACHSSIGGTVCVRDGQLRGKTRQITS
jgi:hypothetical protein